MPLCGLSNARPILPHYTNLFHFITLLLEPLQSYGLEKCLRIFCFQDDTFSASADLHKKCLQSNGGREAAATTWSPYSHNIYDTLLFVLHGSHQLPYRLPQTFWIKSIQLCYTELRSILPVVWPSLITGQIFAMWIVLTGTHSNRRSSYWKLSFLSHSDCSVLLLFRMAADSCFFFPFFYFFLSTLYLLLPQIF